jgi:hypothetical protein
VRGLVYEVRGFFWVVPNEWVTKTLVVSFVYYEEIKRKLKKILIYECRCDEILRDEAEGSTLFTYTG